MLREANIYLPTQDVYNYLSIFLSIYLSIYLDVLLSIYLSIFLYSRYVEGGNYISTNTGCGELWGHVDGDHMFSFRGIPYSIQVDRYIV